jgi:hypothetical protein
MTIPDCMNPKCNRTTPMIHLEAESSLTARHYACPLCGTRRIEVTSTGKLLQLTPAIIAIVCSVNLAVAILHGGDAIDPTTLLPDA